MTATGVGPAATLMASTRSSPEHGAQPGEDLLVGLGHPRGQLVGHRCAALLEADLLQRGGEARLGDGVLFLGLAGHHDLQAGLSFSQIRGTAKNHDGRTSGR